MRRWTEEDIKKLKSLIKSNIPQIDIAEELNRSYIAISMKVHKLNLAITRLTQEEYASKYIKRLPEDLKLIGTYVNSRTSTLHEHICGYKWDTTPARISRGNSCPKCAKTGFNPDKSACLYLIYFKKLNLYKIGISSNLHKRLWHFGKRKNIDIILVRYFKLGIDAKKLETIWLKNVKDLLFNSGKLADGNTETFKYDI